MTKATRLVQYKGEEVNMETALGVVVKLVTTSR